MLHLNKYENNKGFTLIEIILAIAILGIIIVSFMSIFSSGIKNIFSAGKKDEAISLAANKLEKLYHSQPFEKQSDLKAKLNNDGYYVENCTNELYTYQNKDYNFCINSNISGGFKVKIVYFYLNGERYIELTSFVREE